VIEGFVPVIKRLSFAHLLLAVLVLSFIIGFAVFVLDGAVTNKGTTGAIKAEYAEIMHAEKLRCLAYGTYATIPTLRHEGLLSFNPIYNSVVYLPGPHCGTVVVGSPAYQAPSG